MRRLYTAAIGAALALACGVLPAQESSQVPAIPLVTKSPALSAWAASPLTSSWARGPAGSQRSMSGMIRIDDTTYRFLGPEPESVPPMEQKALTVTPTRTVAAFEAEGVRLNVTFASPLGNGDLDLLSRPVAYVTLEARSTDGKRHTVSLYFDAAADWLTADPRQFVDWRHPNIAHANGWAFALAPPPGQKAPSGREWFYLISQRERYDRSGVASAAAARRSFAAAGVYAAGVDYEKPRRIGEEAPVVAHSFELGEVGKRAVSRFLVLAYGPERPGEPRPWWMQKHASMDQAVRSAMRDYHAVQRKTAMFDAEAAKEMQRANGITTFRQWIARHELVTGPDGQPLFARSGPKGPDGQEPLSAPWTNWLPREVTWSK